MSNLIELQVQIEQLQKQAAEIKARDFDKTVIEIREKMQVFGIAVKDLLVIKRVGKLGKGKKEGAVAKKTAETSVKKQIGKTVAAKFRGPNGETWSGRGLSPRWLTSLIEQGASRDDFAIKI